MTKQEEIANGVITNITKACPKMLNADIIKLATKILKDEDSQGVVIGRDKKITSNLINELYDTMNTIEITNYKPLVKRALARAGYKAVESLIIKEGLIND